MVSPQHLKVDVAASGLRAQASHDADEPPVASHHTTLWLGELRVYAEYGLFDSLAVQAMFPLRLIDTRTRFADDLGRTVLDPGNIHHRDEVLFGPGDPQLLLHGARLFAPVSLGARLGVSLPLGNVNENPYRPVPHQHLQFGTGSFDPLLSIDASVRAGPLGLSAFGFAQVPLYAGRQGYQAGTRLTAGFTVSAPLGDGVLRASVLGFNEWAERWDGVVPPEDGNQGRTDLYLGAGVTMPFAEDWTVSFDLRGRAWGQAKNAQLELPLVLEVSLGRLFHFESGEHEEEDEHAGHDLAPVAPSGWIVVDTWASWCEACRVLDARLKARPELGVRRVQNEDPPYVLPHVQLIAPDGRVVYEASGTPDELMRGIDAAMSR